MKKITQTFQYGKHSVTLETGRIARQASSVLVCMGDTVVLCTVVGKKTANAKQDFFPLTVHYQEKTYAAGKVPGGYFKREGRPTEKEILSSRLIDRPLRPLFPEGFVNEVQVIATVMSMDPAVSPDVPAMIGAAAAVAISGIPFNGPLAAARVGYQNGEYLLNPSNEESKSSQLDLIVAGTKQAILMVESQADQLSEEVMLGAVLFGHQAMQVAIDAVQALADQVGATSWEWQPNPLLATLKEKIAGLCEANLRTAYQDHHKTTRIEKIAKIREQLLQSFAEEETMDEAAILNVMHELEKDIVRTQILSGDPRIDGRDTTTVRPITIETGILPRAHGSALFTRGETQALVVTTLGTERDAQTIDDLDGDRKESFMLHYNFPPFCVGETGMMSGPKRREIGHGKLAKRAMEAVVPGLNSFPYVIRVVSEITESNGSSSMASVCGTSLALMDAGVPTKAPVAGIAMGLIKDGNKYAILTDILGDEDHLGDMDFKVAGTHQGVTALQMDIKILGITKEIMERALDQAKAGRLHILKIMEEAISSPRQQVSSFAPRILTVKINPDKIRDVIGKGGVKIRELTESTGCTIDIAEDGTVKIAAETTSAAEECKRQIELITTDVLVGEIYSGPIVKIADFGAFVEILPGKQGMVHISQIMDQRVENIRDHLQEGQIVKVKVTEIDRQGKIRLSMKEME